MTYDYRCIGSADIHGLVSEIVHHNKATRECVVQLNIGRKWVRSPRKERRERTVCKRSVDQIALRRRKEMQCSD
jgi:hypothetical protein